MRLARLFALLALGATAVVPQANAHATQTLAFTFVVPCDAESGATSLGLELPKGWYAVTIAGACSWASGTSSVTVATPCDAPVAGPVPCKPTIDNVSSRACYWAFGGLTTRCEVPSGTAGCGYYSVQVSTGCVDGPFGLIEHPGGTMSAKFNDYGHADNIGAFLVTVVWTPL